MLVPSHTLSVFAHDMIEPARRNRSHRRRYLMSALQIKLGPKPTGNEMNDVKIRVVIRPAAHNNHPPCAGIRANRNHGAAGHRAESPHFQSDQGLKLCRSFRRLVHIAPRLEVQDARGRGRHQETQQPASDRGALRLDIRPALLLQLHDAHHGDRGGLHCDARAPCALRSSHSCAAEKRVSPGTVAARLIDFHFGSKPGACSLSIRENR
jgi:hypothetical protein